MLAPDVVVGWDFGAEGRCTYKYEGEKEKREGVVDSEYKETGEAWATVEHAPASALGM